MPTSDSGKAISSRNATTHGLFARDVVLPALGEDPAGYGQIQDEWTRQLTPRNLLEQHYVEKIAAASWRGRACTAGRPSCLKTPPCPKPSGWNG